MEQAKALTPTAIRQGAEKAKRNLTKRAALCTCDDGRACSNCPRPFEKVGADVPSI